MPHIKAKANDDHIFLLLTEGDVFIIVECADLCIQFLEDISVTDLCVFWRDSVFGFLFN